MIVEYIPSVQEVLKDINYSLMDIEVILDIN